MQQTGPDVKLLPEEQGPLPLITPLCEQAKSLMEGKFNQKLLICSLYIARMDKRHGKVKWKGKVFKRAERENTDCVPVCVQHVLKIYTRKVYK